MSTRPKTLTKVHRRRLRRIAIMLDDLSHAIRDRPFADFLQSQLEAANTIVWQLLNSVEPPDALASTKKNPAPASDGALKGPA